MKTYLNALTRRIRNRRKKKKETEEEILEEKRVYACICVSECLWDICVRLRSCVYPCAWEGDSEGERKREGGRSSDNAGSSIPPVRCSFYPHFRPFVVLLFFFLPFSIDIFIYMHINTYTYVYMHRVDRGISIRRAVFTLDEVILNFFSVAGV